MNLVADWPVTEQKLLKMQVICFELFPIHEEFSHEIKTDFEMLFFSLRFLMLHLNRVSLHPSNKMDAKNLATVFSPNLVHSVTEARRPESIISEMELNNVIVEHLIRHANEIFKTKL